MAVIAKFDCRVFWHINSLENENKQHCRDNTTKSFLVLGKISLFFHVCDSTYEGPKKQLHEEKCSQCNGQIHIQLLYEATYVLKWTDDEIFA